MNAYLAWPIVVIWGQTTVAVVGYQNPAIMDASLTMQTFRWHKSF